jgi:hypothetical protein
MNRGTIIAETCSAFCTSTAHSDVGYRLDRDKVFSRTSRTCAVLTQLLSCGYQALYPRVYGSRGVKLATSPHLVLRLEMTGVTSLFPTFFMACTGTAAHLMCCPCVCTAESVVILYVYGWRLYSWRCISTAWEQDYGRDIATDGDVQLTVVDQPIHSAFQVAMVSPDKLQAELK